jgi:hypothetical protein
MNVLHPAQQIGADRTGFARSETAIQVTGNVQPTESTSPTEKVATHGRHSTASPAGRPGQSNGTDGGRASARGLFARACAWASS